MNKILVLALIFVLASCVSSKKFNQLTAEYNELEKNLQSSKELNQSLNINNTELQGKTEKLLKDINDLNSRLNDTQIKLDESNRNNLRITNLNKELDGQLKSLTAGSSEEISRLMEKLEQSQDDLQKREEILQNARVELEKRSLKLTELEDALKLKDEAVKQLRQKVMDALLGFNDKGLTIMEKNGKVYVSLDEQLLFKTGQWEVDPKGQQALAKLAEVLGLNKDINVLIEGHTDDVPMKGTGLVKDNWDLSVMRATAVTRILLKNKAIEPNRIIAAGRSEFIPIDGAKTPEARQKNRRTEIILTPRLDEIFKLLENN